MGYDPNAFDFGVKLYATEASEIPIDYSLEAFAISQSWDMGVGRLTNFPITKEGASWAYRDGEKTDFFD